MNSSSPFRLVLATNNKHKVGEIRKILRAAGLRLPVLTLEDFPKRRPVVENKPTIEGNALKKAKEVARNTGCFALSDDTGLFVDAIGGRPGVYSARFAGPGCNFEDNNRKILRLLNGVSRGKRGATFRCVAALAAPNGRAVFVEGRIRGRITEAMAGGTGFGYDPIFLVPSVGKTFSEMGAARKNRISHRARAFRRVPAMLRQFLKKNRPS